MKSIIPVPYWVTYKDVVNYAGATCVFVDTDEAEGFQLQRVDDRARADAEDEDDHHQFAVESRAARCLRRAELERIAQIAKDRGIWVMTDECYHRFLYDGEPYSMAAFPGMKETVIVAGSLSKTYAMTGWRIGLRAGAGGGDRRDHEAAEPLDFESEFDRAESGG